MLTRRGWEVNVKRIYRLYREEGLIVRRLKRKRVTRERSADALLTGPNQEWALDFVSDSLASGRGLRALTIVDSYTLCVDHNGRGVSTAILSDGLARVAAYRKSTDFCRCASTVVAVADVSLLGPTSSTPQGAHH
jgi:putative transposase